MTAPVDVSGSVDAVLTHHVNGLRLAPKLTRAQFECVSHGLNWVRDAVAELVGAVSVSLEYGVDWQDAAVRDRIVAALARVGAAR